MKLRLLVDFYIPLLILGQTKTTPRKPLGGEDPGGNASVELAEECPGTPQLKASSAITLSSSSECDDAKVVKRKSLVEKISGSKKKSRIDPDEGSHTDQEGSGKSHTYDWLIY